MDDEYSSITSNGLVDSACCVDDNNIYGIGKNHGDYVSCVTEAVNSLKKSRTLDNNQGGKIVNAAAQSAVNMPPTSNKGMSGDTVILGILGFLAVISFLELDALKR